MSDRRHFAIEIKCALASAFWWCASVGVTFAADHTIHSSNNKLCGAHISKYVVISRHSVFVSKQFLDDFARISEKIGPISPPDDFVEGVCNYKMPHKYDKCSVNQIISAFHSKYAADRLSLIKKHQFYDYESRENQIDCVIDLVFYDASKRANNLTYALFSEIHDIADSERPCEKLNSDSKKIFEFINGYENHTPPYFLGAIIYSFYLVAGRCGNVTLSHDLLSRAADYRYMKAIIILGGSINTHNGQKEGKK